jgi:uncharacterized protein YndB with AHSA1/START domain
MTATKSATHDPAGTTPPSSTDRIEKRVLLKAPRSRVWRAITDHAEFGSWFGMKLEGPFAAGKSVRGKVTIPKYEHLTLELAVERIEPERLFSYRWHPGATDPKADYSQEPMTLVEFRLADAEGGTSLEIIESGFDELPAARRSAAFRGNEGGWTSQVKNIERHVSAS